MRLKNTSDSRSNLKMKECDPKTIAEIISKRAALTPDRIAMVSAQSESWTFGEIQEKVRLIASHLRSKSGQGSYPSLRKLAKFLNYKSVRGSTGGRYAIVMDNGPQLTLTILGAACAGTAMPLNPIYQVVEFRTYLKRLGANCLVVDKEHPLAEMAARDLSIPVIRVSEIKTRYPAHESILPKEDDIALILMTSGSTGQPKLVPLSHRNLCVSASQVAKSVDLSESDICLSMWELHHIGGLVDLLLAPLISGGAIISTKGFDSTLFFRLLEEYSPTWFQAVPTTLHEICSMAKRQDIETRNHQLRFLRSVAAKLPENLQADLEEKFAVPVIQTFGMTEAGPLITSTGFSPASRKPGSVGSSCGSEIRILDSKDETLPAGLTGEVAIRGDNVFAGYEDEEEENKNRFKNGWFLTGDLGWLDEAGNLFLAGRSKQLINRGGEKINPLEVEDVMKRHFSVEDAAAFAVEHRTLGEDIAVAVIRKPGTLCTENELKSFVSEHLAAFKVPQRVLFMEAFPLTGIGKLDRPALARMAAELHNAGMSQPADEVEQKLAEIWAREMDLESIGMDENFFVAGGDSLMGVRVLLEVEKWLGEPLPDEFMTEINTIRNMAQKLRCYRSERTDEAVEAVSPLVREIRIVMSSGRIPTIQGAPTLKASRRHSDTGDEPPLYWCFNSPDKEMGRLLEIWSETTSLIGLYSVSTLEVKPVADHYFELIKERRNGRPFFIGGNCRGAWVVEQLMMRFEESNIMPAGVVLMEHVSEAVEKMNIPLLYLVGQEKSRVTKKEREQAQQIARSSGGLVEVSEIRGRHGQFFRPENVESVHAALQKFILNHIKP
jgi:oxalate---CoA ligase